MGILSDLKLTRKGNKTEKVFEELFPGRTFWDVEYDKPSEYVSKYWTAYKDKGIVIEHGLLKVVEIGKDGITEDDILIHDAHAEDPSIHWMLVHMKAPEFPVALGVIRDVEAKTYDQALDDQIKEVKAVSKIRCMNDLLNSGDTWEVK